MEVYAINTKVKIGGTVNAIITGINIRANRVVMHEYNAGKIEIGFTR
jgi:hypothetical protein